MEEFQEHLSHQQCKVIPLHGDTVKSIGKKDSQKLGFSIGKAGIASMSGKMLPRNHLLLDPFQHFDISSLCVGSLAGVAEYEWRN
jgi:hypothetical protein